MVDEHLLQGQADGEAPETLLPADLMAMPPSATPTGRARMENLSRQLGREALRARLVQHLCDLGEAARGQARAVYEAQGLADSRRGGLGLALQRLFERADLQVLDAGWEVASGTVAIDQTSCHFRLSSPHRWNVSSRY